MINAYPNKIINIHHSLSFRHLWERNPIMRHLNVGEIIGATSHYVTTELDAGPIEQDVVRIDAHRTLCRIW